MTATAHASGQTATDALAVLLAMDAERPTTPIECVSSASLSASPSTPGQARDRVRLRLPLPSGRRTRRAPDALRPRPRLQTTDALPTERTPIHPLPPPHTDTGKGLHKILPEGLGFSRLVAS